MIFFLEFSEQNNYQLSCFYKESFPRFPSFTRVLMDLLQGHSLDNDLAYHTCRPPAGQRPAGHLLEDDAVLLDISREIA
jgi:hypothetical protein